MELELSKELIKTNQILSKTRGEHVENIEIIVPDYLPDAKEIIKTDAIAFLKEKYVSNDKITISGEILFNALYLPESINEIKSIRTKIPFKNVFTVKGAEEQSKLKADLNLGLVEGTIVNSRKISLKAIVSIDLSVYNQSQIEVIKNIIGPDNKEFEILTKPVEFFALTDISQKEFSIEEDLYLPVGKKLIGELIKNQISIETVDKKVISNKVIIKGYIYIKSLYTSLEDDAAIESLENEVPFSTIVDIEGVDEEHTVDIGFNLIDANIKPTKDSDGDMRILNVAFNISSTILAYKNIQTEKVFDAFSTQYQVELNNKEIQLNKLLISKTFPVSIKDIICVNDEQKDIKRVIDVSLQQSSLDTVIDFDEVKINGTIEVSVICIGGQNEDQIFCIKKALPVCVLNTIEESSSRTYVTALIQKLNSSFNVNMSGEIEIRINGDIEIKVFDSKNTNMLESVVIKEKKEPSNVSPLLYAYYPQKGDTIFNVSKRYGIKVKDLINTNKLECKSYEDALDSDMLLIPIKRK